jgi:hypothetical protein
LARQPDGSYRRLSLFAPENLDLTGLSCSLKLVDLDGDGTPEVRFALSGATGFGITDDWYFRWDGAQYRYACDIFWKSMEYLSHD